MSVTIFKQERSPDSPTPGTLQASCRSAGFQALGRPVVFLALKVDSSPKVEKDSTIQFTCCDQRRTSTGNFVALVKTSEREVNSAAFGLETPVQLRVHCTKVKFSSAVLVESKVAR
jgi:hypothetical protein